MGFLSGDMTRCECGQLLPKPDIVYSFKGAGAEWMGAVVKPKYQDNTLSVFSNRSLPDELLSAVRRCCQFILDGTPDDAYDRAKVRELLRLQAACKAEFEKVVVEGDDVLVAGVGAGQQPGRGRRCALQRRPTRFDGYRGV